MTSARRRELIARRFLTSLAEAAGSELGFLGHFLFQTTPKGSKKVSVPPHHPHLTFSWPQTSCRPLGHSASKATEPHPSLTP
jgi:hypothetical protein